MFFLKYFKITEGQHMLTHGPKFTNVGKMAFLNKEQLCTVSLDDHKILQHHVWCKLDYLGSMWNIHHSKPLNRK